MEFKLQRLLGPLGPFQGMNSAASAAYLPPGKMTDAVNVRSVLGTPQVRQTMTPSGGNVGNTFRGFYSCVMDGVPTLFAAASRHSVLDGKYHTAIYRSLDSGATYYPITTDDGTRFPYGITEFVQKSAPTGPVEFALVADRPTLDSIAHDCLIIQDGSNAPLLYGKGATHGSGYQLSVTGATNATPIVVNTSVPHCFRPGDSVTVNGITGNTATNGSYFVQTSGYDANHFALYSDQALTLPAAGNGAYGTGGTVTAYGISRVIQPSALPMSPNLKQVAGFAHYALVNDHTQWSFSSSDATKIKVSSSAVGASGDYLTLTVNPSYTKGNSAVTNYPLGLDASASQEIVLVADSLTSNFWADVQIEVGDGTHWIVISNNATFVPLGSGFYTGNGASYQIGLAIPASPGFSLGAITSLRFTWNTSAPSATATGNLYVVAAGGQTNGGALFSVAIGAGDARTVGPQMTLTNQSFTLDALGGSTFLANVALLDDARFRYDYTIYVPAWDTTQRDAGINLLYLYRQESGAASPYLVSVTPGATWNGATWSFTGATLVANNPSASVDFGNAALDASYSVIPTGLPMTATAQRLFVGSGNRVWYSGAEKPFQFRQWIASDSSGNLLAASPGSLGIDGEIVQAFLSVGSLTGGNEELGVPQNGVATVYVLTDRTCSVLSGWDATSLNKRNLIYSRGTYAPHSVAPSRTGFFFLDTDCQVVNVQGFAVQLVSRDVVDNRLAGIPAGRILWVWAVSRNDRYYLAYTPSGGTVNSEAMVFDVHESRRLGQAIWTRDVFPSAVNGVGGWAAHRDGSQTRLLGIDPYGLALEHEAMGAIEGIGGSGVTWSLTYPEIYSDLWSSVKVRRVGVAADANIGTLTVQMTGVGRLAYGTSSATIYTDGLAGARSVRWDAATTSPGIWGTSVSVQLSGQSPSGSRLYQVLAEVAPFAADGPDINPS